MARISTRNCCVKATASRPSSSRRNVINRLRHVSSRKGRSPVCSSRSATRTYSMRSRPRCEEVMMLSAPSGRMDVVATRNATATVFVVDDDVSVRESLELLIRAAGWQALTFDSAPVFLAHPRHSGACCLILDVALPGRNGLEPQEQIRERTDMPIIFITGHGDIPMSVRAMKAGAVEFLTKPFNEDVLLRTIQQCVERSRVVLREQAEMRVLRGRYESLTPREREVMALVVPGLLNKQVGAELGISEITVKAHRGQLMRKMQADSLAGLVTMTARLNLRTEEQI